MKFIAILLIGLVILASSCESSDKTEDIVLTDNDIELVDSIMDTTDTWEKYNSLSATNIAVKKEGIGVVTLAVFYENDSTIIGKDTPVDIGIMQAFKVTDSSIEMVDSSTSFMASQSSYDAFGTDEEKRETVEYCMKRAKINN